MFVRSRLSLVLSGVLLLAGCRALAQDPAPADSPSAPVQARISDDAEAPQPQAGDFESLLTRYRELDQKLESLGTQYAASSNRAERERLRDEYSALVREVEKIAPQLQTSALAAFKKDPTDKQATAILIGSVANDYRHDDYDAALNIANQMFAAGCEDPVLYAYAGCAAFCADDYDAAEKYLTIAKDAGRLVDEGARFLSELPERKKLWQAEQAIRAEEAQADNLPRVKLTTDKGEIVIELFEDQAPNTVANFISLIEKKHYDGTPFHRVLPGFMAQGGDPTGTGSGGPGYKIPCECYRDDYRHHFRGSLSMAHAGKDTGGSQFFLTFRPTRHLDRDVASAGHTCFGRVVEGMDVLPKIQRRNPGQPNAPQPDRIVKAEVLRKREHAYDVKKTAK